MELSSAAHAVDGRLCERVLELVAARLEHGGDRVDLGPIGAAAGRAQADLLEHLLDLATCELLAVADLVAERFRAVARAGEAGAEAEQLVRAGPPVVVPVIVGRDI